MSPSRKLTPSQDAKIPAHLYGTRAAIFFLMHPSRATDCTIPKTKKYRLVSNAKAPSVPAKRASLHLVENHHKTKVRTLVTQVDSDEFHFF